MATVHIDRLLETCKRMKADDIYLHPGRPPELGIDGCLRALETRVLDSADVRALMESITPEPNRHQLFQELATEFDFDFGRDLHFRAKMAIEHEEIAIVLTRLSANSK